MWRTRNVPDRRTLEIRTDLGLRRNLLYDRVLLVFHLTQLHHVLSNTPVVRFELFAMKTDGRVELEHESQNCEHDWSCNTNGDCDQMISDS